MVLISDITSEIITKLEPLKAEFNCSISRLDKQAVNRPRSGNEIFVGFEGRNPSAPKFMESINQVDEIDFEVLISTTELRTQEVAFPILERVRAVLTGFLPTGAYYPLHLVGREKLLKSFVEDGLWVYQQIYRLASEYEQSENL